MPASERQDALIYRGASALIRWTRTVNGSVSGWTVRLSVRVHAADADPLVIDALATIADAGSTTTPGVFSVTLTKAQTLALTAQKYAYSLERVDTGVEDLLAIGALDVRLDVRNAA